MQADAELARLEEMLQRADTRYDSRLMGQLPAPDFFEFGRSGGGWSRADVIHAEQEPLMAVLPLPELQVNPLNE